MKVIKIISIILMLNIFNTTSYAFEEDCNTIKQNIVKKLACKAMGGSSGSSQSEISTQDESSTTEEKTGIMSKLFKRPNWMKKKN